MATNQSPGHILIVDDDSNITELLAVNLRSEGYTVEVLTTAEDVDRRLQSRTRLVIVDAMKQPYSGMDLIYDFKDDPLTEHIGIILYSPIKSERMVIDALDAGADDYIVKPFSLRELVARVKSIIRRHHPKAVAVNNELTFKDLSVDVNNQTVKLNGAPLKLSNTEFAILNVLLNNVDTPVPRAVIHKAVWADETAGLNERVVDTNISRLRKKLGPMGSYIVNRSGQGYMLTTATPDV